MLKITYITHSSFFIETDRTCLLFDYYVYIFSKEFFDVSYTEGHIDKNDLLIGNFSFEDFCEQFESDKYNGTKVERIDQIVSHKSSLDSVLLINEKEL